MKPSLAITISIVSSTVLLLAGISPAHAESDPFPGIAHMTEIPGTRVSSPAGFTQSQWEATASYQGFSCPTGAGNAISVDVTRKIWSAYCIKTWQSTSTVDAWQKYYQDKEAAKAVAYQASLAWNTKNPGKQLCFEWGPIISPDGGQSSGGICANPVQVKSEDSPNVVDDGGFGDATAEQGFTPPAEGAIEVATFISSLQGVPAATKQSKVTLPKLRKTKKHGLAIRFTSKSPKICSVRNYKVSFAGAGKCKIRIAITNSEGKIAGSTIRIAKN
jgi:hypothetical protein